MVCTQHRAALDAIGAYLTAALLRSTEAIGIGRCRMFAMSQSNCPVSHDSANHFNLSDFDAKKDKAGLSAARTSCMKETPKRAKIRAQQAREQA